MSETSLGAPQPSAYTRDVIVFGEALVDFLPESRGRLRSVERFVKRLGGAPANLSVGLARLGCRCELLAKLGDDEFGYFLRDELGAEGVGVEHLRYTRRAKTGITFISLTEAGERSFFFFREPSADLTLDPDDFADVPLWAPIVHLGSNLMTYEGGRKASLALVSRARQAGRLVTLDANIRLHLWPDVALALSTIREALHHVDVLKVSDEELALLAGPQPDIHRFYDEIRAQGVVWLVVTMGPDGARVVGPRIDEHVPAPRVEAIDTTGAGDAFFAGFLAALLHRADRSHAPHRWLDALEPRGWRRVLAIANQAGSAACTALGATTALPASSSIDWDPAVG